jgi:hypothetical protein
MIVGMLQKENLSKPCLLSLLLGLNKEKIMDVFNNKFMQNVCRKTSKDVTACETKDNIKVVLDKLVMIS